MTDCKQILSDLAGDKISDDEVTELLEILERERDARRAGANIADADEMVRQSAIAIGDAELIAKQRERYAAYKNVLVRRDLWSRINEADAMKGNPSLGIMSALSGVNAPIRDARYSVDSLGVSLGQEAQGALIYDLKAAGVLTQFNSMKGDFEIEVASKVSDLNSKNPTGLKVSEDARKIAEIIAKHNEAMRVRLNREGAFIGKRDGFFASQSHNQYRIHKTGFDKWSADIEARLDFDKMGILPADRAKFLSSAYDAISSGVRLDRMSDMSKSEADKVQELFSKSFKGPRNIARAISAARTIEFKTPRDAIEYSRVYGHGSLRESIVGGLDARARKLGMMRILGHNPEAMIKGVVGEAREKYRGDGKKLAGFQAKFIDNIDNVLKEVTGDINITRSSKEHNWANVSSIMQLHQIFTKLGKVILSVPSDLAITASSRMYQGRSLFGAWQDTMLAPVMRLSGGERRIAAEHLRAGIDGMTGAMMSRFNPTDEFSGRMAKAAQLFFKLNLLTPWTDGLQSGITIILSRDMASVAGKAFDDLPPAKQRLLRIYGLDGKNWEVARLAVKNIEGGKYLLAGEVGGVRGAVFTGMTEAQQNALRTDVENRLWNLYKSEAEMAVIEPGARERAIMRQGLGRGTPAGVAIRQLMLFKSFGTTVLTKGLGRHVHGSGAKTLRELLQRGAGENLALANLIAGMWLLGIASYQAKQIGNGREPRELDGKTIMAGLLQGGGAGIYGDFLFGEYNRFGGGALGTMAGPSVGTMADAVSLWQKAVGVAVEGDGDLRGDSVRFAKSNIPGANLIWTQKALDYLVFYNLQEMINPGYLRRMERRVERENNQRFLVPPSEVIQRGGGFK